METLLQDVRYGFRMLRRNLGFTTVAVLTLALGIGANTAIFSVIEAVLLRKLPYEDPQRLILIWGDSAAKGDRRDQVSYTDLEDWRRGSNAFEDIAAYARWSAILAGSGAAQRVPAIQVSDAFFRVLRTKPLLGRLLLPEDQQDGKDTLRADAKYGGDIAKLRKDLDVKFVAGDEEGAKGLAQLNKSLVRFLRGETMGTLTPANINTIYPCLVCLDNSVSVPYMGRYFRLFSAQLFDHSRYTSGSPAVHLPKRYIFSPQSPRLRVSDLR